MTRLPWQVAFVVLAFAWGSSFWWIGWGLESLTPIQVTLLRSAIAAVALLIIVRVTGTPLSRQRAMWARPAVDALLINVIPGVLTSVMQTHINSSATAILIAAIPLGVVVATFTLFRGQTPSGPCLKFFDGWPWRGSGRVSWSRRMGACGRSSR